MLPQVISPPWEKICPLHAKYSVSQIIYEGLSLNMLCIEPPASQMSMTAMTSVSSQNTQVIGR